MELTKEPQRVDSGVIVGSTPFQQESSPASPEVGAINYQRIDSDLAVQELGTAPLCIHCRNIFADKSAWKKVNSREGMKDKRDKVEMLRSALGGCLICRELLCMPWTYGHSGDVSRQVRSLADSSTRMWPLDLWTAQLQFYESRAATMSYRRLLPIISNKYYNFSWRNARYEHVTWTSQSKWQKDDIWKISVTRKHWKKQGTKLIFDLSTYEDDPMAEYVPNRTINRNPDCHRLFGKIHKWLMDCDHYHPSCQPQVCELPATRPTMLVDVSPPNVDPGIIRLCYPTERNLQYTALSYCWGALQPNSTSKSNLRRYLKSILLSTLPQAVQNAVEVTRKLNLRYLWVDSLCIIQDSEEEKANEISRMHSIYNNAYVTIIASSAENCRQGFLGLRQIVSPSAHVAFRGKNGEKGKAHLRAVPYPMFPPQQQRPEPLDSRAWALQERFMSRRMLIFHTHQVVWACSARWGRDGGNLPRSHFFPDRWLSLRNLENRTISDWRRVIKQYSSRSLTDPADKLPALSSIAEYFSTGVNGRYLAGLWSNELLLCLCWHRDRRSKQPLSRPPFWRAPSWSFMAVDGPVDILASKAGDGRTIDKDNILNCSILACEVKPSSNKAPFGQIVSGHLKLSGRLLACSAVEFCTHTLLALCHGMNSTSTELEQSLFARMAFDTVEATDGRRSTSIIQTTYDPLEWSQAKLFALLLCMAKDVVGQPLIPWGLVLAQLPSGDHHRVGWFEVLPGKLHLFEECESQIITIV